MLAVPPSTREALPTCTLKPDCPQIQEARLEELIARYGGRVPRYTSYPTAAHFGPAVGEAEHRAWLGALDPATDLSLYVHIPFCAQLCWYCGCHTSVANSRAPVLDYVTTLEREIALVAAALPARFRVKAVHLGGGTPNLLHPRDLVRLMDAIRGRFDVLPTAEVAAEIDPRCLTVEWVMTARELGLTRASIGVQDLDPLVQAAVNRRQPFEQIAAAVDRLRAAGIDSINLDLMYGLPHQTTGGVLDTLDRVLSLAPERIALFGYAHVPWMKPAQRLLPERALPGPLERFRQQQAAADRLAARGYEPIGLDHFARPDDALAQARRSGRLHRNFQGYTADDGAALLGLGASAISRFPGGYAQNEAHVPQWRNRIEAGLLATGRGCTLGAEERLRADAIERLMCDLSLDLGELATRHGPEAALLGDAAANRLTGMERDGLVQITPSRTRAGARRIQVTALGRPFVRTVSALFDELASGAEDGRLARAV